MSTSNLTAKLAKELKRNTKKTAVLALLCVVAIWFWAPLVWGWIGLDQETSVAVETPEVLTTPTSEALVITAPPPTLSKEPELSWKNLTDLFAHNQLMETAELQQLAASPFGRPKTIEEVEAETAEVGEAEDESEDETTATKRRTPNQLGLKLTSTITGRGMQLAVINGHTCRIGAELVVRLSDEEMELKLVEVQADAVALFDGTELHRLERAPVKSQMQLSATTSFRSNEITEHPKPIYIDAQRRE